MSNAFENNPAADKGGALLSKFSSTDLNHNTFTNDTAPFAVGSTCEFEECEVPVKGGDKTITLKLKGNTFQNNSAHSGGAMYAGLGNYTLISNAFQNNSAADEGGALTLGFSFTILNNNTFTNNDAPMGGAIYAAEGHNVKMYGRNIIRNNTAQYGGGILSLNCDLYCLQETLLLRIMKPALVEDCLYKM